MLQKLLSFNEESLEVDEPVQWSEAIIGAERSTGRHDVDCFRTIHCDAEIFLRIRVHRHCNESGPAIVDDVTRHARVRLQRNNAVPSFQRWRP